MVCGETPLAKGRYSRVALVAETAADARDVIVEGDSGLLACHPKDWRPIYEPSKRRLTWPNGAVATTYSGEDPDQLRGPQHDLAWCDELAKYRYAQEAWDMLQFGLRLGDDPRQVVTTTPRPMPIIKALIADPQTVITRGRTMDNAANLAPQFLRQVQARYEGTRLGRQELNAEMLDDVPGALWTRAQIDASRWPHGRKLPDMQRVVIGVDPRIKDPNKPMPEEGAETGIVAVGLGIDGRAYVLEDGSCRLGPSGWASRAIALFDKHEADVIVAEINQGGAMVTAVLQAERPTIPVITVHASRGKVTRAEPIASLYGQGRVSHVGTHAALEDQMVLFTPNGIEGDITADPVDAMVWAITELMPAMVHEGAILKRSAWRLWPAAQKLPECTEIVQFWQASVEEDELIEMAACTTWGIFEGYATGPDGREYRHAHVMLLGAWRDRVTAVQLIHKARELGGPAAKGGFDAGLILMEKRRATERLVNEMRRSGVSVKEWESGYQPNEAGRFPRAHDASIPLEQGCCWYPDKKWARDAIAELAQYPFSSQDVLAGTMAGMLVYLRQRYHLEVPLDEPQDDEERAELEAQAFKESKSRRLYGRATGRRQDIISEALN